VGDENKRRRGIARVVATVDIYPEITNKPKVCNSLVKKKTCNPQPPLHSLVFELGVLEDLDAEHALGREVLLDRLRRAVGVTDEIRILQDAPPAAVLAEEVLHRPALHLVQHAFLVDETLHLEFGPLHDRVPVPDALHHLGGLLERALQLLQPSRLFRLAGGLLDGLVGGEPVTPGLLAGGDLRRLLLLFGEGVEPDGGRRRRYEVLGVGVVGDAPVVQSLGDGEVAVQVALEELLQQFYVLLGQARGRRGLLCKGNSHFGLLRN
jgi:hypothetical protein